MSPRSAWPASRATRAWRSTTAFSHARIQDNCNASATACLPPRSTDWHASGSPACRTRIRRRIVRPHTGTTSRQELEDSPVSQLGRALRTETTVNNTRDFAVGKRPHNLPELRQVGFQANRRLLDVERISHDCMIGEDAFQQMQQPQRVDDQRVAAMRYGDPRVQALLQVLVMFRLSIAGFTNRDLRELVAPLLGLLPSQLSAGSTTYDLRRLRLRGLIQRLRGTHRYAVTDYGLRIALFYTRSHSRLLRPGLSQTFGDASTAPIRKAMLLVEQTIDEYCQRERLKLAA